MKEQQIKLKNMRYKTAYSSFYKKWFEIIQVKEDDFGELLICARIQDTNELFVLRECELDKFIL
jgi:hypothetical protein